jgi:predicted AAA+ superfamily ATPase
MFQRAYLEKLTIRMNEPRKFIQVLMGPRQVGKTTLIQQLIAQTSLSYMFDWADAVPASPTPRSVSSQTEIFN